MPDGTHQPAGIDPAALDDPKGDRFMDDPWAFYRVLRERQPLWYDPRHEIWFVTSYELVDAVLKDARRFSSAIDRVSMRQGGLPARVQEIRRDAVAVAPTMSQNDAPSHDVFKAIVKPFFQPARLRETMEPFVRERIARLIEALPRGEVFDFLTAFAVPLPIAVIGRLLGLSHYGEDQLKRWSDAFADEIGMLTSEARAIEIAELTVACHQAMLETCAQRRAEPREDVISTLVAARIEDGRPLDDGELLGMLTQMLVAGNETTTNTLAGGLRRLGLDPALHARLRAEPDAIPLFVEETLRLESPVQGQFRQAREAVHLGGQEIPAGALLHVRLASANRDESCYGPDDDQPNLDTKQAHPHRAFGVGMHFCLGAMLSRLELRIAFEELTRDLKAIELAAPDGRVRYNTHFHLRGPLALPIRVE